MYNDGIRTVVSERDLNERLNKIFLTNMKVARKKNHLSQGAFADLIGVSKRSLVNWELGNNIPRAATMDALIYKCADIFDLDPGVLFEEDFKNRYDPSILEKKEEPEKVETKVVTKVSYSDKDVAIKYLVQEFNAANERAKELTRELDEINKKIFGFSEALSALGYEGGNGE